MKKTLFDKVWEKHVVVSETETHPATIFIDLHLIHEVTSPQAFTLLKDRGLSVRRPDLTLATIDHSTPTLLNKDGSRPYVSDEARIQVDTLLSNTKKFDIETHGWDSKYRGIVHVMGPELGATHPGATIVCGDSHTSTHGAFGAIAFGIGTTQVGHVLANQCILMRKPKTMAINVNGELNQGVTPKDIILHIISLIGIGGGTGYAIEYRGNVFENMSMDGRMTVCNMSIEAGARCGMIAPDEVTFEFLKGRKYTPENYEDSCAEWLSLSTDEGALFDKEINIKAEIIKPMVTYGTHPGMGIPIDSTVPQSSNPAEQASLNYMQINEGDKILGMKVDKVFIGSCTNSRMDDLRAAASILNKKKIAPHLKVLVVPGSAQVKASAEKEGLDKIFKDAGADWREPGCSMCLGMNGDIGLPGELIVSTSNRNFMGRQGPGVRTILVSPETAASTAIAGVVEDPRNLKKIK
ncbi:3-isopropylmalate dehydratase large subunit [Hellea sp.]|jgi:3-isopropylmalate/(R)-2-methylmalate dehydratase large subunit|nr:3-isopropylmalate dehydratase large subunit [Hellea sp.]MDC0421567.1 3-isopropylmalate dehydratase large subunit [Hellea sp.]MDC1062459.1 3-isopropylmalate dehydratase large subunit [Hellea sp.]